MAMSLNSLRVFVAVADTGNMTKAAERLRVTQPAASKAVKALEDELGVALFHRDKRSGLTLTDTGRRILGSAREMLQLEERIHQTAYLSRNLLEGTLRIASLPLAVGLFLARALAAFRSAHPHVDVEVLEGSTLEVNRMVAEHAVEFGVSLAPAPDFESRLLMEDRIVALSRDPVEGDRLDLATAEGPIFICKSAWESMEPALARESIGGLDRFRVVSAQTVRSFAEEGVGVGLQARSILPESGGYTVCPVEPEVRTDFVLIANRFDDLSHAARAFIETMGSVSSNHEEVGTVPASVSSG